MNPLFRLLYRLAGWKNEGVIPATLRKGVFAVTPHASWIDFIIGLGARAEARRDIGFLGKEELFNGPFGFIFRWLGGTPVKRFERTNMVEEYVKAILAAPDKLFAIAPEGTRKDVGKLRSGFYYMAHQAQIPILMVGFDYPRKTVVFAEPFMPTGNFQKDMQTHFVPFFKTIGGLQKSWLKNYELGIFDAPTTKE